MKKLLCFIVTFLIMGSNVSYAQEKIQRTEYTLFYHGNVLLSVYDSWKAYEIDDRVYLPIRGIAEALSFNVYWKAGGFGHNYITLEDRDNKPAQGEIGPLINTEETAISIAKSVIKE